MDNVLQYIKSNIDSFSTASQTPKHEMPKNVFFPTHLYNVKICWLYKKDYIKLVEEIKESPAGYIWKRNNIIPKNTAQFKVLLNLKEGRVNVYQRILCKYRCS